MTALLRALLPFVLLLAATACTPGEETADEPSPTPEATTPAPPDEPVPPDEEAGEAEAPDEETDTDTGLEPVGEFGTEEVATDDFPSGTGDVAQLVDVRMGSHPGFDRIVLEFDGDDPPTYRVAYVDPPVRQDGSGHEMDVAGSAFLEMRVAPASGVILADEEPEYTYEGPDRLRSADAEVVAELVRNGDFEANLAWTAGLDLQAPFAVTLLDSPLRLVVDISHG